MGNTLLSVKGNKSIAFFDYRMYNIKEPPWKGSENSEGDLPSGTEKKDFAAETAGETDENRFCLPFSYLI